MTTDPRSEPRTESPGPNEPAGHEHGGAAGDHFRHSYSRDKAQLVRRLVPAPDTDIQVEGHDVGRPVVLDDQAHAVAKDLARGWGESLAVGSGGLKAALAGAPGEPC